MCSNKKKRKQTCFYCPACEHCIHPECFVRLHTEPIVYRNKILLKMIQFIINNLWYILNYFLFLKKSSINDVWTFMMLYLEHLGGKFQWCVRYCSVWSTISVDAFTLKNFSSTCEGAKIDWMLWKSSLEIGLWSWWEEKTLGKLFHIFVLKFFEENRGFKNGYVSPQIIR